MPRKWPKHLTHKLSSSLACFFSSSSCNVSSALLFQWQSQGPLTVLYIRIWLLYCTRHPSAERNHARPNKSSTRYTIPSGWTCREATKPVHAPRLNLDQNTIRREAHSTYLRSCLAIWSSDFSHTGRSHQIASRIFAAKIGLYPQKAAVAQTTNTHLLKLRAPPSHGRRSPLSLRKFAIREGKQTQDCDHARC